MEKNKPLQVEEKKNQTFKRLSSCLTAYLFPAIFSILILFTSGYARTTTRQDSFNSNAIMLLAAVMVVLVIVAILKAPIDFYKRIIHPIRNGLFKNITAYMVVIPVVLFLTLLLYYFLKGNEFSTLAHYLVLIVFSFTFTLVVPFKKFASFYKKVVLFLSLFSLIVYLIMLFAGNTQFFSSTFISRNDAYYRSLLGLYFRIDYGMPRNYGPFWEPGIFSLLILIAVVFEIIFSKKINFANLCIYIAAIITTFSTSALLLLPFCLPLYFAVRNKKKAFYITIPVAITIIGIAVILGNPEIAKIPVISDVFSKLFSANRDNSFKTRLMSPVYGLYLFGKSFGLGFGPNIFDAKYETLSLFLRQTSTVGWLAGSFGVVSIYFLLCSFVSLFFFFKQKYNLKVSIIVIVIVLIIINCEPMYTFSIFWILFFYPISYDLCKSCSTQENNISLFSSITKSKSSTKLTVSNLSWSLIIKIAALLIGLLLYPRYVKYFGNQTSIFNVTGDKTTFGAVTLGAWLVILQILSWVLTFDIGIGNGLKNKIVEAINENREDDIKKYISCSYISNFIIIIALLAVGLPVIFSIDFNSLLNVPSSVISHRTLQLAFALAFISICLEFFLKIVLNIYQALQKQAVASFVPLVSTILLILFVFIVRIESMSTALIVLSVFYIFSVNFPLIVTTFILFKGRFKDHRPSLHSWSFPVAKSVVAIGGIYFLIQIFLLIINSTNKIIISNVYGAEIVASYEPYLKIFSAICAVASAISLPVWTLVLRADVQKDYTWIKKMQKSMLLIGLLFAFGALIAAALMQVVFDVWLGSASIKVDYFKSFIFAAWAIASISSYFVSAFSNGLKVLKPQIIILGFFSIAKVPTFILLRHLFSDINWIFLVVIDTFILFVYSVVLFIYNRLTINKRMSSQQQKSNRRIIKI